MYFRICLLLLLCASISNIYAQNDRDFFKVYPVTIEDGAPDWVRLMYGNDPNVREVSYLFDQYWKNKPLVKNIHVRNYLHWHRKIEPWVNIEGYIRKPTPTQEASTEAFLKNQRKNSLQNRGGIDEPWECLGPIETYAPGSLMPISWQVNVYCVHVFPGNESIMLAGTEGGGAFISTNKGMDWLPCTYSTSITSVTAVQFHPLDDQIMLIGGNRRVFRSVDGGTQWAEVLFMDGEVYQFSFHPTQPTLVYAATSRGLYRSEDSGLSWELVFQEACWDVKVHLSEHNIWFALRSTPDMKKVEFIRSTDTGNSWSVMNNGWYQPQDINHARDFGGKIGLSIADPDRIYAALIGESKPGDDGWLGLYVSGDKGQNWSLPAGQIGGPYDSPNRMPWNVAAYSDGYHQGFYNFGLAVSPTDANKVWIGSIRLTESTDGGKTFRSIGAADSQRHSYIHADIQDIFVHGSDVWIASDGGLDYSSDELMSHESRKKGITGSDFWGFDLGWNLGTMVGGKYHNGNSAFHSGYGKGNFLHIGGVEEPTGYINTVDNQILYTNQWWAGNTRVQRIPTTLNGPVLELPSLPIIPNESYIETSSSGIYFDPRYANRMYVGKDNAIWRSSDGGQNFDKLHTFGAGEVHQIAQSYSDPNVIYLVFHQEGFWSPCQLFKSEDGGITWKKMTDIPADRWRLILEIHPLRSQEIWVGSSLGANGQKLFQSIDGGVSWKNKTQAALDHHQIRSISLIPGTTQDELWIATNRSVWRLQNTENGQLEDYSDGLPEIYLNTLKIKPLYSLTNGLDSTPLRLLLPTYGRGIFARNVHKNDIAPWLQISASTDTLYCSRDTLTLESLSILGTSVEWQWNITPNPQFIDDATRRNPKIVPGAPGSYSIQLIARDINGDTLMRTFDNFITVKNECNPEGEPGRALTTNSDGDFVQLSGPFMATNTFSVSAWIYPDGIQPDYSAIFMNDDETAGLNFRGGNNTLGYHWPGGAWWWDSGLQVPANQWSHVAMVASPDGVEVYVNGVGAKHVFNAPTVQFGSAKIGSYKGWSSRNIKGQIDEVSIWSKSLSRDEIRLLKHLTLSGQESDLVSYYQFNETQSRIFDRINTWHGFTRGNSRTLPSTAPVAGGQSQLKKQPNGQVWVFDSLGLELKPGVYPQNSLTEWTAFRFESASEENQPALAQRWILNEYTQNAPDFEKTELRFKLAVLGSASDIQLFFQNWFYEYPADMPWDGTAYQENNDLVFQRENRRLLEGKYSLWWDQNTRTSKVNQKNQDLSVFPNPVANKQELTLAFEAPFTGTLRVINMQGKTLSLYACKDVLSYQIPLNKFAPGNYMLWYESAKKMGKRTFVIE